MDIIIGLNIIFGLFSHKFIPSWSLRLGRVQEIHTSCPLNVVIGCSVDRSHSFTVASSEPDTTFSPSNEKHTALLGLNSKEKKEDD